MVHYTSVATMVLVTARLAPVSVLASTLVEYKLFQQGAAMACIIKEVMGTVDILKFPRILVVDTARTAPTQGIYAAGTGGVMPLPTSVNAVKDGMESNVLKPLVLWTILSSQSPILSRKLDGKR